MWRFWWSFLLPAFAAFEVFIYVSLGNALSLAFAVCLGLWAICGSIYHATAGGAS